MFFDLKSESKNGLERETKQQLTNKGVHSHCVKNGAKMTEEVVCKYYNFCVYEIFNIWYKYDNIKLNL